MSGLTVVGAIGAMTADNSEEGTTSTDLAYGLTGKTLELVDVDKLVVAEDAVPK